VNALVLRGDEGRGTLRYASGSCEQALIRRFQNGETPGFGQILTLIHSVWKQTQGTETSKYLEERTSTETPLVVASERGTGQCHECKNWNRKESRASEGDSPVQVESIHGLE
jgi:hypothetical protein